MATCLEFCYLIEKDAVYGWIQRELFSLCTFFLVLIFALMN